MAVKSKTMNSPAHTTDNFPDFTLEGRDIGLMRSQTWLFQRLAFRLSSGGVLLLRGPNGSGKSSLLRAIAGFLPLNTGQISCNGRQFDARTQSTGLTSLWYSQADGLAGPLTGLQNLSLVPLVKTETLIEETLANYDPFSISGFLDRPVRSLSTGQRQRVALTRLCFAPATCLWLLDEPNSALDEVGNAVLDEVLATHQQAGGMTMIASHHRISDKLTPDVLQLGVEQFT